MDGSPSSGAARRDYFISYTRPDRAWAEWVAWELERRGLSVILQAWDFDVGSSWIERIHAATQNSGATIAIVSSAYLESDYGTSEWQAAWRQDPLGRARKLVCIRVEDCALPGLIGNTVALDLFGRSKSEARRLLQTLSAGQPATRSKPYEEPPYPGDTREVAVPVEPTNGLPILHNLPSRNPNFTGREVDLRAIRDGLSETSTLTVHALHGLGGIGKTQTVIEYAHRFADAYELLWWFDAEQPGLLSHQMKGLAEELGLRSAVDPTAAVQAVRNELRHRRNWLLIFDNAENVDDVRDVVPDGPGHVLVTTRRSGFRSIGKVLTLNVPPRRDSVALIRRRAPALTAQFANRLAEHFGDLPLGMAQAAAYIDETNTPPDTYLKLMRTHEGRLLCRGRADGYPLTISTAWSVAIEALRPISPASVELLHLCAWLAPEPINLDLFSSRPDLLPSALVRAAADELSMNDVVGHLASYSLVRRTDTGLVLHRLVQSAIRAMPAPFADKHPLAVVVELLRHNLHQEEVEYDRSSQEIVDWAQYLPHVLAAIDSHSDEIVASAESLAWLMHHAGRNITTGDPRCEDYLRRAVAAYERLHGPDHFLVGGALADLGWKLEDSSRWQPARDVLERAIRVQTSYYGADDPRVAAVTTHYASCLRGLGDPETALPLLEHALEIHQEKSGPSHPATATTLNILGLTLQTLGRPAAARPLLERAVGIRREYFGADHPMTATHMTNLSSVLIDLGELSTARALVSAAVAIREAAYGPDSTITAHALYQLGRVLSELNDPSARPTLERVLRVREARYGPHHPSVQMTRHELARLRRY